MRVSDSEVAPSLEHKRALVVGVGGLGCAALASLADSGIGQFVLADEDEVDETNLHRQILFTRADIGRSKLLAARDGLVLRGVAANRIELCPARILPHNARQWVRQVDVVLEGADNYATKFLVADACVLEQKPVVHGAAVGWNATVLSVSGAAAPCYRCVFEDIPAGVAQTCDSVGVMGPVVGIAGALMAEHTLRLLSGNGLWGTIHAFDGRKASLRGVQIRSRRTCPLCGQTPSISSIEEARYMGPSCAAICSAVG